MDEWLELDAVLDVEHADALGSMEFVTRHAEHIRAEILDIDLDLSDRLDGIGVEQGSLLMSNGTQFLDGKDRSDLVVSHHDGNEDGDFPDGLFSLSGASQPSWSTSRYVTS